MRELSPLENAQLIRNRGVGNALELGPVFQTDLGSTQINLNLVFEPSWAAEAGGTSDEGTQLKYQWQVLWRLRPGLRMSLQGFGELGRWNRWSDMQSHRAGPVLRLGSLGPFYLWGKTYGSRGDMFSAQVLWRF